MLRICVISCTLALSCVAQQVPRFGPAPSTIGQLPEHVRLLRKSLREQLAAPPTLWASKEANPGTSSKRCAHMMTYVPSKDLDRDIVIGRGADSAMEQLPPMPTCENDIRQLPAR